MRDVVVVDTSIAIKWVIAESDSPTAKALLAEWINHSMTVIAPVLLAYEITNVLYQHMRSGQISLDGARVALPGAIFPELVLDFATGLSLSLRAMELAQQFRLPATYDAHYLALAEREACDYWTADERLWNGVRQALPWVHWLGSYRSPA